MCFMLKIDILIYNNIKYKSLRRQNYTLIRSLKIHMFHDVINEQRNPHRQFVFLLGG